MAEREVNITIDIRQIDAWLEAFAADFTGEDRAGGAFAVFAILRFCDCPSWGEFIRPVAYVVNEFTSCSWAAPTIDEKAIEPLFAANCFIGHATICRILLGTEKTAANFVLSMNTTLLRTNNDKNREPFQPKRKIWGRLTYRASIRTLPLCLGLLALTAPSMSQAEGSLVSSDSRGFNIAPQPLYAALSALAEQSGVQFVYNSEMVKGLNSPGLSGQIFA